MTLALPSRSFESRESAALPRRIVACLEGSTYFASVCQHAAWLAAQLEVPLELLHASEPGTAAGAAPARSAELLLEARTRLRDEGVEVRAARAHNGPFLSVATQAAGEGAMLVLGRHGFESDMCGRRVGRTVEALVHETSAPLLIASRVYLGVRRGVVRFQNGPREARGAGLAQVRKSPLVRRLDLQVFLEGEPEKAGTTGLLAAAWQRAKQLSLGAAARQPESGEVDLLVLSRGLRAAPGPPHPADASLASRLPILVL